MQAHKEDRDLRAIQLRRQQRRPRFVRGQVHLAVGKELVIKGGRKLAGRIDLHAILHGDDRRHAGCHEPRSKSAKRVGQRTGCRFAAGEKHQSQTVLGALIAVFKPPAQHGGQVGILYELDLVVLVCQVEHGLLALFTVSPVGDDMETMVLPLPELGFQGETRTVNLGSGIGAGQRTLCALDRKSRDLGVEAGEGCFQRGPFGLGVKRLEPKFGQVVGIGDRTEYPEGTGKDRPAGHPRTGQIAGERGSVCRGQIEPARPDWFRRTWRVGRIRFAQEFPWHSVQFGRLGINPQSDPAPRAPAGASAQASAKVLSSNSQRKRRSPSAAVLPVGTQGSGSLAGSSSPRGNSCSRSRIISTE